MSSNFFTSISLLSCHKLSLFLCGGRGMDETKIEKGDEKEEKMDKVEKVEKVHESYVWCDTLICVIWLINMCDITRSCVTFFMLQHTTTHGNTLQHTEEKGLETEEICYYFCLYYFKQ